MKFVPMNDYVAVELFAAEEKSKGGLFITSNENTTIVKGTVVASGPGRRTTSGDLIKNRCEIGDVVWFPKFNSTELTIEGKSIYLVSEQYIFGFE